jgi:hypothetical protein
MVFPLPYSRKLGIAFSTAGVGRRCILCFFLCNTFFKTKMLVLVLIFEIFLFKIFAQHFEISTGYGFYEAMTASAKFVNKSGSKFGLSIGYDNNIIFNGKYQSAMLEYQRPIFRNYFSGTDYRNSLDFKNYNISPDYRYFLDFKVLYWHLVDDYYYWNSLSFVPSVGRNFAFSYKWSLTFDAGIMMNFVLYRQRINYLNAGWPYKLMPNFRLMINYKL